MILNQWRCPYPDGHNPKLCPAPKTLVAFGGGGAPDGSRLVRVVDWSTGNLLLEHPGRMPHWLTDTVVVFLEELGGNRDQLWRFDTVTRQLAKDPVDPALSAANEFSASDGVWASYLANPRRVVVNNNVMSGSHVFRGVSVSYHTLLTCVNDAYLQVFDAVSLQPLQVIDPSGPFNAWRNCRGTVFHGYWGETYVARPGMSRSVNHTVTPWHAEGVAAGTIDGRGHMWAATATEIAPSTKETRVGVLVRPVGEVFALSVWDIECNTLDLGYLPGRMVVAGASTRGELRILELDENALLQQVDWPVAVDRPFPSAQAWAGYHQYTMRADWPRTTTLPLGNATFVWEKGALATVGDMPVIIPDHLMAEVTRPEKVVGLYEYSESSDVNTINEYCRRIRTDWGKRFPTSPIPPVISYMHPAQIEAMGTAPTEVDIFAPQFYFSTDEMPPRIDYFSKMAWWMTQLPADRLWMPTVQTYDRNFQWSAANMSILAGQQGQLISLARAYPFITGYGCFAVNRPGGIVKWPVLRESLTKVATIGGIGAFPSRWPYRPPVEGTDPIDPPVPPVGEDDMTQADLERWTAAITDPMLFGALERWHNEVLPRDRPKDSIIKNGDNTDMWTGDVVTGGANGYFIRAQMLHYYIACSKGRPTDQAWGDGYDAAMRSYNKAVGRPQ